MDKVTQKEIDNLRRLMDDAYSFFDNNRIPDVMDRLMNTTRDIEATADNDNLKQEGIKLFNETSDELSEISDLLNDINNTIAEYVNSNI